MQEYLKLINNNYNLKLRIANSDNLLFILNYYNENEKNIYMMIAKSYEKIYH